MAAHRHQHFGDIANVALGRNRFAGDKINLKAGAVAQSGIRADDLSRPAVRQRHQIPVSCHVIRNHLSRGRLAAFGQFRLVHQRHGRDPLRQGLVLIGVVQHPVFAQNQTMRACFLNHLRGPVNAAAGIIAAQKRHDHSVIGADIFKPAENPRRDVENIAFFQHHFAGIAPAAPKETPAAFQHEKGFGRIVIVQRVVASRRLARRTDVKARGFADMHVLIRAFADTAADDGKIFFQVAARRVRIDKGGLAGHQIAVAHDVLFHFLRGHLGGAS